MGHVEKERLHGALQAYESWRAWCADDALKTAVHADESYAQALRKLSLGEGLLQGHTWCTATPRTFH